jgi:crotonobetainyl-CoA:carnitine CoA-transferase CaiB-like acyl-CoA transferase
MPVADGPPPAAAPVRPLEGVRVLDLTRVLAGPFCTMILADLGAEVIKVEDPAAPDYTRGIPPYAGDVSHYFLSVNRGKKSIAIDLKSDGGQRLGRALAARSDVVVENFRPGVLKRLGMDYERLRADRPDIVLCSVSGFGQTGPDAGRAAVDVVVQALSGAMSLTGEPGGEAMKLGIPMGDLAGALYAAIGILAALRHRDSTGEGTHVDVPLVDSLVSLLSYLAQLYLVTGEELPRAGNRHHTVPGFGPYEAADGTIVLSAQMDSLWQRFCAAADRPDLAADARYATVGDRQERFGEVEQLVAEILGTRTIADWDERFRRAGLPQGPLNGLRETLEGDYAVQRGLVHEVDQPSAGRVKVLAPAIRFLAGVAEPQLAHAPALGEHSRALVEQLLGESSGAVDALIADGVLVAAPTSTFSDSSTEG